MPFFLLIDYFLQLFSKLRMFIEVLPCCLRALFGGNTMKLHRIRVLPEGFSGSFA